VEVLIDHHRVSTAIDNSIKGAEQLAAEKAITALKELGIEINNHQGS
jgi:dsRNA-specific ribonuclease